MTKQEKSLARRENNLIIARKKLAAQRSVLNKDLLHLSKVEIYKDSLAKQFGKPVAHIVPKEFKTPTKGLVWEYVITDLQYRGKKSELKVLMEAFRQIRIDLQDVPDEVQEVRLSFLGDDIDGTALHKSQMGHPATAVHQTITIEQTYALGINSVFDKIKSKNIRKTVAFVPTSNHGQTRPHNTTRGQVWRDDFGFLIYAHLEFFLNKEITLMPYNNEGEINDKYVWYGHGDRPWQSNPRKIAEKIGQRLAFFGHNHQPTRQGQVVGFPAMMPWMPDYGIMAGFTNKSVFTKIERRKNNLESTKFFRVK